jgi:hypothetical protein
MRSDFTATTVPLMRAIIVLLSRFAQRVCQSSLPWTSAFSLTSRGILSGFSEDCAPARCNKMPAAEDVHIPLPFSPFSYPDG